MNQLADFYGAYRSPSTAQKRDR